VSVLLLLQENKMKRKEMLNKKEPFFISKNLEGERLT
jgi:hypothetical protein